MMQVDRRRRSDDIGRRRDSEPMVSVAGANQAWQSAALPQLSNRRSGDTLQGAQSCGHAAEDLEVSEGAAALELDENAADTGAAGQRRAIQERRCGGGSRGMRMCHGQKMTEPDAAKPQRSRGRAV